MVTPYTPPKDKYLVAILGATGSVGQKFIELLQTHPWFEIAALCASERSSGKPYRQAARWFMQTPLSQRLGNMVVHECDPQKVSQLFGNYDGPKIVFSGLDASVAGEIESEFAESGFYVISNSKNHRWDSDVPLIIPEINAHHLDLIKKQKTFSRGGAIITNPNCSTIGLAMALKPLDDQFGVEAVNVTTLQALSGAGYPGVPSLDIIDNVVPFIGGEEEKVEQEPRKILGQYKDGVLQEFTAKISAQCNRVAVLDGHLECVQVKLKNKPTMQQMIAAWEKFRGVPQELDLYMAPQQPIHYLHEENYPQPKLHRMADKGMAVSVGRLRPCNLFDYKFVILSHNTIRGAAGGTILIAELLLKNNVLKTI